MQISTEIKQRIYIQMRTALNISARAIHQVLLLIQPETAFSYSVVSFWSKRFREGRESVEDDPRPGRPVTADSKQKPCFLSSSDQQVHCKSPIWRVVLPSITKYISMIA